MAFAYVRYDGFRVKHHGIAEQGDIFVSHGWLCHKDCNTDGDCRVIIYHRAGVGYTYEEMP